MHLHDFNRPQRNTRWAKTSNSSGIYERQLFLVYAQADGYEWLGKTSSTELSETTNSESMHLPKAAVCYAYFSDVSTNEFRLA